MFKIIVMALCLICPWMVAETTAKPLAYVQDDVITQYDVDQRIKVLKMQLPPQAFEKLTDEQLKMQVLEQMIGDYIQWVEAKRLKISTSMAEVEQSISRAFNGNSSKLDAFKQRLNAEGVTWEEFCLQFEKEVVVAKLHQALFSDQIKVTEKDINLYLKEHQFSKDHFKITSVVLPKANFNFSEVKQLRNKWSKNSVKWPKDASVNMLDYRMYSNFPTSVQNQLVKLKVNAISDVIISSNNYILVKLIDHKVGQKVSKMDAQRDIYKAQFEALFKPWYQDLLKRTYIKKVNAS